MEAITPCKPATFAAALGVAALLLPTAALAGITVSPSIVILEPDAPQEATITVINDAGDIAYVTVEPREVMARGEVDEQLRTDPDPESLGLLATPARLILEGNERRGIRILPVSAPAAEDRVWRVKIAPVAGRINSQQSGVAFLVGYDALIIQRPVNPAVALSATREGRSVTIANTGNTFTLLTEIRHCSAPGTCTTLPESGRRLYGQRSITAQLPEVGGTLEVDYRAVDGASLSATF